MRTVTVNVNNRCPLRCKHCSLGFSESYKGDEGAVGIAELQRVIRSIDQRFYDTVLMAGGEPSLHPGVVRSGVEAARDAGLKSALVTAPIWAKNPGAAASFLDTIGALDMLILSYDTYHLEFLDISHYRNAGLEALKRRIILVFQIAFTRDDELRQLVESLKGLARLAQIHPMRTVMVGNAEHHRLDVDHVQVNGPDDLARIPRGCVLGNAFVDSTSRVHGCCWSTASPSSPFTVPSDGTEASMAAAFAELEQRPSFAAVRTHGFIGALSQPGQQAVVDLVRGERFSCECDLCLRVMRTGDSAIWSDCARAGTP